MTSVLGSSQLECKDIATLTAPYIQNLWGNVPLSQTAILLCRAVGSDWMFNSFVHHNISQDVFPDSLHTLLTRFQ